MAELRIDGIEIRRFERDVEVGSQEATKQVRNTVRKSTFATEAGGKVRAAVLTGFMRNSITSDFIGSNRDIAVGTTGPEAEYSPYVELGTSRQAPQPFMGPAADEEEPNFYAALDAIDPLPGA
ncbi:HK97-gp10 family putative phage morphogenesis protein [Glycomyces sp. NPDC021274]|uniref:HK97-gp10 family putative phage morphogenesis protein n=1 Tax=Glycomyces sp. NPDC021274 TaxID=3155120 RepID=UPI0033DFEA5D